MVLPTLRVGVFPSQFSFSESADRHTQKYVSMVTRHPVRLTLKINDRSTDIFQVFIGREGFTIATSFSVLYFFCFFSFTVSL